MTDLLAATRDFHTALKAAGVNSEVRVTLTRADWWALCGCVPREFVSTETDGPRITMDGVVVRGI